MVSSAKKDTSLPFCLQIRTHDNLRDDQLELPERVVRRYGECMADSIVLEVRGGKVWTIEMRKSCGGKRMWLQKGWEEFADFYSLDVGFYAVFSFEGRYSHFQVRIFGSDDMEIDYSIPGGEADGRPKRRKSQANDVTTIASKARTEQRNDFSIASSFKSEKPYVKIKMTPTYMSRYLNICASFACEHLCTLGTSCNLTLETSGERIWKARCIVSRGGGSSRWRQARIQGAGWKAFKKDNHLEVHDVCVFELIGECKFRVSIFRAKEQVQTSKLINVVAHEQM